jgi:predicted PurR-regulated permease PerM
VADSVEDDREGAGSRTVLDPDGHAAPDAEGHNGPDRAGHAAITAGNGSPPGTGTPGSSAVSHVTAPEPATVISETQSERLDREIGPEAPRRDRMFAAASAKGVPLRTILAVDAVVILTWVAYRVVGRLREVILWILISAFIALVLNPAVHFLQRHRLRRGTAVGVVMAVALLVFVGLLGLFGYPLVNALSHLASRLPTMVNQVEKGHGWLAHTLQRFHLLSWVQKNAPKLKSTAENLAKPALNAGEAVASTLLAVTTIGFLTLFMLLEAPRLRTGVLGAMREDRRLTVEDVAHRVSRSVTSYVLGTFALSLLFGVVVLVTLLILGVPFALIIGLWVALVAMIPLVGGLIAGVPSVIIALLHSPTAGVVMAIVFVGFQLVENHFLYPVVMSRTVRMNPLWVLLSVLVGANLGGVFGSALGALTGALVAIPVGGAIQVISREIWDRTRASDGKPTDPGAGPPGPVAAVGVAGTGAPPGARDTLGVGHDTLREGSVS